MVDRHDKDVDLGTGLARSVFDAHSGTVDSATTCPAISASLCILFLVCFLPKTTTTTCSKTEFFQREQHEQQFVQTQHFQILPLACLKSLEHRDKGSDMLQRNMESASCLLPMSLRLSLKESAHPSVSTTLIDIAYLKLFQLICRPYYRCYQQIQSYASSRKEMPTKV